MSISISSNLEKQIKETAKKYGISKSAIVKEALRGYFIHQSIKTLRAKMVPHAQKAGYFTDEDIFNDKDIS